VSDLVFLECRIGPLKRGDGLLLSEYEAFFELPEIMKIPLDHAVFHLAADIRARDGLKTPDAIHVAAAICGGCAAVWTNDNELDKVKARVRVEQIVN
jgi:predicted nucleic acid-binding protein